LLALLTSTKQVRGQGIEIDEQAIYACVAKGLSVFHGDIDTGLSEYQEAAFDYVILNQSLQQVRHFENVLTDALRVGRQVIAGFPNFAYLTARIQLGLLGKAPVTPTLPYTWYESPNVHFFSLADFFSFCQMQGITIVERMFLDGDRIVTFWPNLFANIGIFLLRK
jgi:methionine biosynthesis protein MetW